MVPRVLIVGAGLTGASTALMLQREFQQKISITVWEKARGSGGRMNTSRSECINTSTVDLGAQYISCSPSYSTSHAKYYDELLNNDVLKPCTVKIEGLKNVEAGTKDYVVPNGMNSIVKFYLKQSGVAVKHNCHLNTIDVDCHNEKETISVEYEGGNEKFHFDVVVLTMPVPQILKLGGGMLDILAKNCEVLKNLQQVEYSSRYALGLYFHPGTKFNVPWAGKYVYDDPCIRWMCIDSSKRGQDLCEDGPTLLVHTSVPFALKYLEDNKENVQEIILQHLSKLLPGLPDPIEVKCHRWRYSQVYKGVAGSPGCLAVTESENCLLLTAGDAFAHTNFDGCVESATKTSQSVIEFLKSNGKL